MGTRPVTGPGFPLYRYLPPGADTLFGTCPLGQVPFFKRSEAECF